MLDLNVTILEFFDTVVDPSQKNNVNNEPKEDVTQPKIDIIVETHPCDKCEKVFPKVWRKAHNIKTLQYTPAPVNRRVGRPAYRHSKSRFFCAVKILVLKFCARKSAKISLKIT